MRNFYEVFGHSLSDTSLIATTNRANARCPFTETDCDGGGNRYQTKIKLNSKPHLQKVFNPQLSSVIPGICSIDCGNNDIWAVCPRRMFGFRPNEPISTNFSLKNHEREALLAAGLPKNTELGIWSEVSLNYKSEENGEDLEINYHFDFIISRIFKDIHLSDALSNYGINSDSEDIKKIIDSAKKGKYITRDRRRITANYIANTTLDIFPDLDSPFFIEVMTASTSGSDTNKGTNISSSFEKAILGKEYTCPGINKRQVWGRMGTQLFSKSALAKYWGGKLIWIVQDKLLENIELTTKLHLPKYSSVDIHRE